MTRPSLEKIIVGMSGGVDSSVSAWLLLQQGYRVEGLFMKNWEEDDTAEYCSASVDLADAQQVCDGLGIPLHTVNFSSEYWDNVFEYFLHEYRTGRTPNPDIMCNREIKFKAFLDHAQTLGARRIATGHYVRTRERNGVVELLRGLDANKDQSYFLYALNQHQLGHALFPVGELNKAEVRAIARREGFALHAKKDSTGICFIGERKFRDFLQRFIPAQPGEIFSSAGERLGAHAGLMYYTIGQRQGLGIGGMRGYAESAWYVAGKRLAENTLVITQNPTDLCSRWLAAGAVNWLLPPNQLPIRCTAKIRYRQNDQPCTVKPRADGRLLVHFDRPQRAVTPGQYVCFYDGETCLGGALIETAG